MYCIHCKAPLAPGASFCAKCGRSTNEKINTGAPGIVCPNCRAVSPGGTRFCASCGGALPAQAAKHMPNTVPGPQPNMQIPKGYVFDPRSGNYYIAKPGNDPATGVAGTHYTWFIPGTGEYQKSFFPSGGAAAGNRPLQPTPTRSGRKAQALLILIPVIALFIGGLVAFAQAGGFSSEELQDIPQGIPTISLDSYSMPSFQPIDGDDPVYEFGENAGAYESTLDPYSSELLDPYDVRSFWSSSNDAASFASSMGLSYNEPETERLRKQVDFDLDIYTGPFDHVLPATDKAECYAYVMPTGNVYRFDYKYYMSASASPQEVADTYYAAADAMGAMASNTKDLEIYNEEHEGFSYDEIVENIASGTEYYSFRTGFGTRANPADCCSVMLLKRDGVLSLIMQWVFPMDESPIVQSSSSSESSGSSESSASSGSSTSSGGVSFSGLIMDDAEPPYAEGLIEMVDYGATPNGSGGYDCYVTIYNGTPDMTKLGIDAWLHDGYEEAGIITLAEPAAFHSGDSHTFYFEISSPPTNGSWDVLVTYWFW